MKVLSLLAILALAVVLGVISARFLSVEGVPEEAAVTSQQASKDRHPESHSEGKQQLALADEGSAQNSIRVQEPSGAAAMQSSAQSQNMAEQSVESAERLREEIQDADSLPAERPFLNGSRRLSLASAQQAFGTEQFGASLERLQQQSFESPAANELSNIYQGYLSQRFAESGGHFSLNAFACGMRVCMGEAWQMSEEGNWNTNGLYSFGQEGPPMHASIYDSFESDSGQLIYQFLFTTDPDSTGIALPSP